MKYLKLTLVMVGVALTIMSCSKEAPVAVTEQDPSIEILAKQPTPGIYVVARFIDTGDNETAQFSGYTFEFQADGDLIVTTNTGAVFTGFWDLNSLETMMEISISGNPAVEDLDDDNWHVDKITTNGIALSSPGPDSVRFKRIG